MKFQTWRGETLADATVSYKIDGVRAHLVDGQVLSRAGKPLYNVPPVHAVCEVFLGSWEETVSAVRTHAPTTIDSAHLYCLDPVDERLFVGTFKTLQPVQIEALMRIAQSKGYEGLVIESRGVRYKVKPTETYDVVVTAVIPGKGKHAGRMGALMTPMGKVGTGFTDAQRGMDFMGKVIEVEAMSLTPAGKFRHPRFIRIREDK